MTFSFGASSSSTPSLFGASSTPAFGASSTPSLFGNTSTPAFGASTPSLFGGGFGATSTPSLFGSTPAFGSSQPAQSSSAFSFSNTTGSLFGGTTPAFGQTQSGFGQIQPASQSGALATVDNKQLTHYTKWAEINPQGQQQLLQLEKIVSQTKEDSRQLDECPRLQDALTEDQVESEGGLKQTLEGFISSWQSDEEEITALNEKVHILLHDTETAMRAFHRSYRWREAAKANHGQVLPPPIRELLSFPFVLPSHFLRKTVKKFQENVVEYQAVVAELEKLLPPTASGNDWQKRSNDATDFLVVFPSAISNIHDLLYHIAAKIDALHERVAAAKDVYLAEKKRHGDTRNPFKEAERRDHQKQHAARTKVMVIPPAAGAQPSGVPLLMAGAWNSQSAPPAQQGGGALGTSPSPSLFGSQQTGSSLFGQPAGSLFGGFGQTRAGTATTNMRKSKAKK